MHGRLATYNRSQIYLWLLFFFTGILFNHQAAASSDIQQQRDLFKQAEIALKQQNRLRFEKLLEQLGDYPVVEYLQHDALKKRIKQASTDEMRSFLDQNKDFPFQYHLLSSWLNILAKREDWAGYLEFYDGRSAAKYKCLALTAKLESGQTDRINEQIKSLWLSGYSQPKQCDRPFEHFLNTEPQVEKYIWQRIEKAFKARRSSLARYLGKKLDSKGQDVVQDWYQAHRNPEAWLERLQRRDDSSQNRRIIVHAVDRLARRNSLRARELWTTIKSQYSFDEQQRLQIQKQIALSTAYQHKAEAKELLEELPNDAKTDNAHLWLARIHLRDEDWIGLIKTISAMPEHLKKEAEWVYWLARAYEGAGQDVKANEIYAKLSSRSTYYGFLAADRAQRGYRINQQQVAVNSTVDEQNLLASNVHLLRARELFHLDRLLDARREWFQGIRKLGTHQIKQAARLASNWKWHENAIKTVAKTGHLNDYDLRFPMPYQQQVMDNINQHDLDPAVIYGVMRRESLFDPLAKSRVGALGLMQLMPSTARRVAKSIGLKRPRQADILDIENNIRLGTQYFKTVLNQFDNNIPLAAAAYNAGPKNVRKWLPKEEPMAADLWVETVPFKETRNYVQAVLAYATIFDRHLGQDVQISSRMNEVKATY